MCVEHSISLVQLELVDILTPFVLVFKKVHIKFKIEVDDIL